MLKHAIDTYNFLLDIAEKLKLKLTTMVGILAVLIAGASLLTVQALGGYSANELSGGVAVEEKASQAVPSLSAQSESAAVTDKKATEQTGTKPADTSKQVGGDSRQSATADSTAKQSFSTKIERASQIAAGTLVAYNANKDQKTYYGGDLLFDTQSLTISRADATAATKKLVVSVPDDAATNQPVVIKDDASSGLTITAANDDTPQSGRSFAMTVSVAANTPVGSYQLHLITNRAAQSSDAWVYHGFITVNVTD
jgi:hypothetical protein